MTMKTRYAQAGKGLSGFIIGLILATLIIAGILFFLNKGKSDFKQPEVRLEPSAPEILTPTSAPSASAPNPLAATTASSSSETETTPATVAPAPHPPIKAPSTHHNPSHQSAPTKKPTTNNAGQSTKPSPEAILNSGSLEKAQQKAQQAAKPANTGSKVLLQIGSYSNRADADAQRAKLAMLGIDTAIHSAKVNGNTVYRIQTDNLNRNQADAVSRQLKQHNIPSLMRTAP